MREESTRNDEFPFFIGQRTILVVFYRREKFLNGLIDFNIYFWHECDCG